MAVLKQILPKRRAYTSIWHEFADFGRILALACSSAVFICGFLVPLSSSAYLLLGAQLVATFSILHRRILPPLRIALIVGCILAITLVVSIQLKDAAPTDRNPVTTIPSKRSFSKLNSLIKEEDGIYLGLKILSFISGISTLEYSGLQEVMEREYKSLRAAYGDFPTPLIATFLGAQGPSSFDVISFPPEQNSSKNSTEKKAVIFLHGVGGNWTLPCWSMSQSVSPLGFHTFCPSIGLLGTWGSSSGSQIFASLMAQLKHDEFKQVYLSGISAGAVGAVSLASQYQDSLAGLILISGLGPGITHLHIKTLLITSKDDERFSREIVSWVLRQEDGTQNLLEHHWIEGDHLAILKKKTAIHDLIRTWLDSTTIH